MRRREAIALIGGAVAWPLAARAQQPAMPIIGFLYPGLAETFAPRLTGFRKGLSETGFIEGRNVTIEYRWAGNEFDRLPELAADLVRRKVTVIATGGQGAIAAKAATTVIPIVFSVAVDPVEVGLVMGLSRPGGNLTGVTTLGLEVGPKRLQLLHEMIPTANSIGILVDPTNPLSEALSRRLQAAAPSTRLQLHTLHASSDRDFDSAFATLLEMRTGGLVITTALLFNNRAQQLAALAFRYAVPTIFQYREFVAAGGLMSYRGDFAESYRVAGVYTGRILKGEKPADLPVQQSTKFELIINLKSAKALGLTVPLSLRARADELIE
jgi:putative ABC transport system substrate-binding protein